MHPHYGVFYREVLERLPPQRHLSVGASGSFQRLRDEYSNQRIQAVKTDYQEDGNKSHDCKKVRSSFLFIPVPEKETFFRRGFLLCFSDLWNVVVYLEDCLATKSVKNGMAKSEVDCHRILKDIRKQYDDIIWVSASIRGTRLIIQVKENEDSAETTAYKEEDEPVKTPVDIVADRDCTLEDAIVRKGLLQAKIGKKVKKGDVLVSGQVPVNNDAGETVGYQYQISDADLTGKTVLKYKDSCENTYIRKEEPGIVKQEHYLKIGKVRVALGGIKNQYEHFTMTGEQWQLRLFDNFYFPVYWGERKAVPYIAHEEPYSQEEIQQILTQRFVSYCEDLEKKGVEIIENNVKIYTGSKTSEAKGRLTVRMPVGTEKKSELIKIPDPKEKEETGEQPDGNDGNSH